MTGPSAARLVDPAPAFAPSFVEALREGFRRGTRPLATEREIREVQQHFDRFLRRRLQRGGQIVLPDGRAVPPVPFSLHWLVAGTAFVGELSFRHRLNAELRRSGGHLGYAIPSFCQGRCLGQRILALGLDAAQRQGLDRVLVTCHEDDPASQAIIEAKGGVLEDVVDDICAGGPLRRYRVERAGRPWPR